MQTTLLIPDMTCGHCQASLERALKAADPAIELAFDLPGHRLSVSSARLSPEQARSAAEGAGYTVASGSV
jgi:copper chaperone